MNFLYLIFQWYKMGGIIFLRNVSKNVTIMLHDDESYWALGERVFTNALFWCCQNKYLNCIFFMYLMLVERTKNFRIMGGITGGIRFLWWLLRNIGSEFSIFYFLFTLYLSLSVSQPLSSTTYLFVYLFEDISLIKTIHK